MKCSKHPEKDAAGVCCYSGKLFCEEDLVEVKGRMYGKEYLDLVFEEATKVKNANNVIQPPVLNYNIQKSESQVEETIIYNGNIPLIAFQFSGGLIGSVNPFKAAGSVVNANLWKVKITSQRIILVKGMMSQQQEQIEYYRVNEIKFTQSIAARAAGVGTIIINSNDFTRPIFSFPFMNPKEYVEKIRGFIRTERLRMGTRSTEL